MLGLEQKTGETPPALLSQPILTQFEQPYFDAFQKLSGSRTWTIGGPAPIPLSEINAYFGLYGIDDEDERDTHIQIIRFLDAHYLDYVQKKGK